VYDCIGAPIGAAVEAAAGFEATDDFSVGFDDPFGFDSGEVDSGSFLTVFDRSWASVPAKSPSSFP